MLSSGLRRERGAILINVAVGSLALIAFTMFVVDYGVLWVSRHQVQNAADAGALAGATALGYDDNDDYSVTGPARVSARQFALQHSVFGQAPIVDITADIAFSLDGAFDNTLFPEDCIDDNCIRVDVYRNQTRSNPLPMIFGQLVGLTTQGIRAMAIAKSGFGNASDCLKPWAIPDKWEDWYDTDPENPGNNPIAWVDEDDFEPEDGDIYRNYSDPNPTGFTVAADYGTRITLKHGNPQQAISPSHFYPVVLPGTGRGGDEYRESIATCNGQWISPGEEIDIEPGNMIGPTNQGVNDLIDADTAAHGGNESYWHDPDGAGPARGYVARENYNDEDGTPIPTLDSDRIVCVPVFDTGDYYEGRMSGRETITIANILGFFIDDMQGQDVVGYLTNCPGDDIGGTPIPGPNSFIPIVRLVR